MPSGNGTLAGVLATLFHLTGDPAFRDKAEAVVGAFASEVGQGFVQMGTLLSSIGRLAEGTLVAIVGPEPEPFRAAALAAPVGHPMVQSDPKALGDKVMIDGRTTAYVCRGMVCSPPVTTVEDLVRALA